MVQIKSKHKLIEEKPFMHWIL